MIKFFILLSSIVSVSAISAKSLSIEKQSVKINIQEYKKQVDKQNKHLDQYLKKKFKKSNPNDVLIVGSRSSKKAIKSKKHRKLKKLANKLRANKLKRAKILAKKRKKSRPVARRAKIRKYKKTQRQQHTDASSDFLAEYMSGVDANDLLRQPSSTALEDL